MDWYDDHCWRCGADATPDIKGRVLCSKCQLRLAVNEAVFNNQHGMEWYLTHCWHCDVAAVPFEDDLGLCYPCRVEMSEAVPA